MKIDKNNYEAFFLDFVEGKLDNSSTLEMLAFLRNHPELKSELESFSDVRLESSDESYQDKGFLKKMNFTNTLVTHRNFEDFCIAYYEKILTPEDAEKLEAFLEAHPDKKKDFLQYGKVMLKADKHLIFGSKGLLLKKSKGAVVRTIILRWTAVAAGIVLAISIFYKSPVKDNLIPENKTVVINSPKAEYNTVDTPKSVAEKPVRIDKSKNSYPVKPIYTVEAKTEVREGNLQYLEPIAIASVKSISELKRPELILSAENHFKEDAAKEDLELYKYAQNFIRKNVLKNSDSRKTSKKITLWNIAEVTLKGYNQLTENEIILHKETDENGKIVALALETENRKYGFSNKN